MVDSVPIILIIATFLAFLAGIGVGGGSLLILWLTFVQDFPHPQARLLNLLFFLPCALITSVFRWRQGKLEFKKILPAVIAGCIAAAVGSYCSHLLDLEILKKLFGGLLLATGLRELFYKPKEKRER